MLEKLREQVLEANLGLVESGLVFRTFGNASGISREEGLVVIKPSGVEYDRLTAKDLVVTDLDGKVVEGELRPSSDLATHLVLYQSFLQIGGVVHTHSRYATAWAQAGREIPPLGTTHADYFYGPVPVTEEMTESEIQSHYEINTGHVIVRRFARIDPLSMQAVLVAGHGPFCWGITVRSAAENAILLEEVARLAYMTHSLAGERSPISRALLDKHFKRKHGPNAYYGQSRG